MRHVILVATLLCVCAAAIADWPQFLGPDRNAISPESAKLAKTWSAEGPKVLWTVKVGPGYGGAAIEGNEVFILDRENDKQDVLRCLSLADGNELWRAGYDAPGAVDHNGSRSTPAVDEKYVFTVGLHGDFCCFDRKTHKGLWSKNLLKDFGANKPNWAVAQSPLLYKDFVIVAPCGRSAGIVAFKKDSGDVAWKSESFGGQQYASAVMMKIDDVEQVVALAGADRKSSPLLSVDPAGGKTLWKFDKWGCDMTIPSPVHCGEGKIFLSGGYGAGSAMIEVKKQGDKWAVRELWRKNSKECGSQIDTPLVWKGHLFVDNNENGKNNGMVCVGLDGTIAWSAKSPNCNKGGSLLADGMIYKADGSKGSLYLIEPTAESFKVVAQAKVLGNGEDWGPLAISGGKLILRDQSQMKCLDVKAGS